MSNHAFRSHAQAYCTIVWDLVATASGLCVLQEGAAALVCCLLHTHAPRPSIPSAPLLVSNNNLITQLRLPSALFHPLSSLLPQVVANLPYNITKDCLLRMLPLGGTLSHLYFMLQVGGWVEC